MDDVPVELVRLFDAAPLLVAAFDGFDRLRYANPAYRAAYFIEAGETPTWAEIMRRNHAVGRGTVIHAEDFEAWLISTQSRRGKTGFRAFETDNRDGRWVWMTETVESNGWMLCVATDITHLKVEGRRARQDRDIAIKASYTDDLTGIANRRFVTARIEDMLRRIAEAARPDGQEGCIAILDLDHFKYINDRWGHHVGDLILRDFARRIHAQIRRADTFGRVGGEEFVLVMPDTPIEQAALLVERMLLLIRGSRPLPDRPDLAYSFSAGLAAGRPDDSAASLYERADKALYSAKVAGRDRICLASGLPDLSAAAG